MPNPPELRLLTPEELAEVGQRSVTQRAARSAIRSASDQLTFDRKTNVLRDVENGNDHFPAESQGPLELHAFAVNWNGDRGVTAWLKVVRHRDCDAGTALWLYWENDPYFFLRFRAPDDADDDDERLMCELSRTIEQRFMSNDFSTSMISFDPQPWIDRKYDNAPWAVHVIPEVMYRPVATSEQRT